MNNPTKPNEVAVSTRNDMTREPRAPGAVSARAYAPPCIEDDLPLEVMSLACQGFRPKSASPLPCKTVGSLVRFFGGGVARGGNLPRHDLGERGHPSLPFRARPSGRSEPDGSLPGSGSRK